MTVTRFTVLRLVPDPIAGEYINIALVAAYPDGSLAWRTLQNWDRAKAFAGEPLDWARELLTRYQGTWTADDVEWFINNAANSVQVDPWRHSISTPDSVLERLGPRYIKEPQP